MVYNHENILVCIRIPPKPKNGLQKYKGGWSQSMIEFTMNIIDDILKGGTGTTRKYPLIVDIFESVKEAEKREIAITVLNKLFEDVVKNNDVIESIKKRNLKFSENTKSQYEKIQRILSYIEIEFTTYNSVEGLKDTSADPNNTEIINNILEFLKKNKSGTLTSNAINTLRQGSIFLGELLTPSMQPVPDYNETNIKMFFYPNISKTFKKGSDNKTEATENREIDYGNYMLFVEPHTYASFQQYFTENFKGVENLLAGLYNKNTPFKKVQYKIKNTIKNLMKNTEANSVVTPGVVTQLDKKSDSSAPNSSAPVSSAPVSSAPDSSATESSAIESSATESSATESVAERLLLKRREAAAAAEAKRKEKEEAAEAKRKEKEAAAAAEAKRKEEAAAAAEAKRKEKEEAAEAKRKEKEAAAEKRKKGAAVADAEIDTVWVDLDKSNGKKKNSKRGRPANSRIMKNIKN
jgi:chemotaxis protein histidine kinase CheA